jgi:hypothetical protein
VLSLYGSSHPHTAAHCEWNTTTALLRTYIIQSWPCSVWFLSVWSPQRCLHRPVLCQRPWVEGGDAYLAYHTERFYWNAINLCCTKCPECTGTMLKNDALVKAVLVGLQQF